MTRAFDRILATLACLWVAAEAALRAERLMPQHVMPPGLEWLWWPLACAFLLAGVSTWMGERA
jgi:hypothetical protein